MPNLCKSLQRNAKESVDLILKAYYRVTVESIAERALGHFLRVQPTQAFRILEDTDYQERQYRSQPSDTSSYTRIQLPLG